MPKKRFSAEQIVVLLRQIEVLMSQGKTAPIACREAGISQQSCATNASTEKSSTAWRKRPSSLAQSIQHNPATLILELSAASTPNIHSLIASPGSQLHDAIVSIPPVQNIHQVILDDDVGTPGTFP